MYKSLHNSYNISETLLKICWWSIIIILSWTSLFKGFTIISNLSIFILYLISWRRFSYDEKKLSLIFICCIEALSAYSMINSNEISSIVRFSLIPIFIALSYFVVLPIKLINRSLSIVTLLLCYSLIAGELYLLFIFDKSELSSLRYYVISSEFGDIYPKYGDFYAIQLVGTAAIPFVFMYSFVSNMFKKYILFKRLILLAGIIIAGNFGFIIAIAVFLITLYFQRKLTVNAWFNKFFIAIIIATLITPFASKFIADTLEEKKDGSNAIRVEQAEILISSMCKSPMNITFGNGLGTNIVASGKYRDYSDNQYFELQSLYFLNQLGIVPFLVFIGWNIYFSIKNIRYPKLLLVYLCYVLYSITNPYIFNTNQIVVIISLVSFSHYLTQHKCKFFTDTKYERKYSSDCYPIQSEH